MGLTQITGNGLSENINIDSNTLKVDGSNNRVGIGTGSPTSKLTVAETGYSAVEIRSNRTSAADNIGAIHFRTVSTDVAYIQSLVDGTLKFRNTSALTERMRIDSSGNVAIGHTSADRMLHVRKDNAAAAKFGGEGGGDYAIEIGQLSANSSPGFNATGGSAMLFKMGGVDAMRLDSSRRLLLGTTTVGEVGADELTIATNGRCGITLRSNSANDGSIFFADGTSGSSQYAGYFQYVHNDNSLRVGTDGTERMRIDSSGRVGIGTSSPTALLHLNATSPVLRLTGSSVGNCEIQEDGSTLMINVDSSNAKSNSALAFRTDNIERMRIDSAGVVSINQSAYNTFRLQNPTSNGANLLIQNSTTGLGAGNGLFFGLGDNEASYVWNYHNEPVIWGTNNVERMRLSNAGDVSIGTSGNQTGSKLNVYGAIGSANTRFACTEHGKGASGTYSSIVFDFAVGGSPATVIFETRAYGYNQDAVDHMFGAYSSSHNKVIRDNNSSGMSVSVTFPNSGGVTHRVTISGSITHPVAAVKATAGGLASSIDLLSITFS